MSEYSFGGRERIAFHSSARMARTEVQQLRERRARNKPIEPPTEKQLLTLQWIEAELEALGIPCKKEIEMARRTKAGANGTIKKMLTILRQRGGVECTSNSAGRSTR